MSLNSWIKKPKNILLIILIIGLAISITFNILNATKAPIKTTQEINQEVKGAVDWTFFFNVALIPVSCGIILGFILYNYDNLFSEVLNKPLDTSDICSIIPGTHTSVSRIPSYYFAHLSFFLSYLFMNAYSIYNMSSDPAVDKTYVDNRKYRSLAVMIILVFVLIGLFALRYNTSHCDSPLGIIVTLSIFTFAGFAWYKFAEYCGVRNSDLMGISQSILPAKASAPVVCARTTTS